MQRYKLQRRLIGPVYASPNMKKHGDAVDRTLERFVEKLKSLEGEQVDLEKWIHILVVGMTFSGSPWSRFLRC